MGRWERLVRTQEATDGAGAGDALENLWQLCNDIVTSAVLIDRLAPVSATDHDLPIDIGIQIDRIVAESIRISEICGFTIQSASNSIRPTDFLDDNDEGIGAKNSCAATTTRESLPHPSGRDSQS